MHLKQLSTTGNFLNGSTSKLLDLTPLTDVPFGEYFWVDFAEPIMQELNNGIIHEIDFDFKIEFRDHVVWNVDGLTFVIYDTNRQIGYTGSLPGL